MIDPRTHLLFNPNSVAVVGASSNFEKASGYPLRNLLRAKFTGTIYPINPHASEIGGIRCYASILDVPEVPDLAVLMVAVEIDSLQLGKLVAVVDVATSDRPAFGVMVFDDGRQDRARSALPARIEGV